MASHRGLPPCARIAALPTPVTPLSLLKLSGR